MNIITVDFDGTLFDRGVVPIQAVIDFCKSKQTDNHLVLLTSRSPKQKQVTLGLARRAGLVFWKSFFTGTGKDMVDNKVAVVVGLNKNGAVELSIDNNPDVRKAIEAKGINTLDPATI